MPLFKIGSICSFIRLQIAPVGLYLGEGSHTPTSSAPSTTSPHDEELIPAALPVTAIRPFSTMDLAIIIPLAFVGLALVLFVISYVAYWRRLPQGNNIL